MRKLKTLSLALALLLLVPSLLMASPSTWGWLGSILSSESLEAPAETSVEEPAKSTQDSTSSKATSKSGYVTIPRDVYEAALAEIEEGNASNKKGGAAVTAAKQSLEDSAVSTKYASKMKYFGTFDGTYDLQKFELGVSIGFIFKDCIIGSVGVAKKDIMDMTDWLEWKTAYKATASIGIIF